MKMIKICSLVFITSLVIFGVCFADKFSDQRFEELKAKYQALYVMEGMVIQEIENVTPKAVEAIENAKKVIAAEPKRLTEKDKMRNVIVILMASYLEEKLKRLYCQLGLIHWEMNAIEEEAYKIKQQLKSEREA